MRFTEKYDINYIEEKLGIDLITLFEAFKNGIYVKTRKHNGYVPPQDLRGTLGWTYTYKNGEIKADPYEVKIIFGKSGVCLSSLEYKKTWALNKEDLLK